MTLKSYGKFEEKLTCDLKNNMRNLANFHQNTWKCQDWYFHEILFSKVGNELAKKFIEQLNVMILKIDGKYEEELTCRFKIDIKNLTNVDSSSGKSKKFSL